jgi:hypothetical protein
MSANNDIVMPGDWILVAVRLPEELGNSEACHKDIVFEDYIADPSGWVTDLVGIRRKEDA